MLIFPFSNLTFKKITQDQDYKIHVISLDPDRARRFVGYDLGPIFLLRLLTGVPSRKNLVCIECDLTKILPVP